MTPVPLTPYLTQNPLFLMTPLVLDALLTLHMLSPPDPLILVKFPSTPFLFNPLFPPFLLGPPSPHVISMPMVSPKVLPYSYIWLINPLLTWCVGDYISVILSLSQQLIFSVRIYLPPFSLPQLLLFDLSFLYPWYFLGPVRYSEYEPPPPPLHAPIYSSTPCIWMVVPCITFLGNNR